ncbi:4-hydroxyphenylacetate 3-monooxygenase oxygenase component [Sphaerisporangium krabiense]|uniref:Aromatic ring hydroxylase n=1 Tax=Sphaerisporangium krabiense TaxID=763782 RepID=A0A7W8Z4U5_9ACTN|nr:4-hydroxyphenylacetate 3-hydroxylase N-terminal domain-containing protein [Sphaerisporangium krabiense]MBB5627494.1 aromatic ring hydroxylase [Sphaerisporangium krabiense]GII64367.1 4-hydroxyphenylacetate 3-monooxygenase oxygenase component [Sphaerisporangium krabiense]
MTVTASSPASGLAPLGALDGERYRASLADGRSVWLDGRRVPDVAAHPAFAPAVDELARLLDLQHDPAHRDTLTVADPASGLRIGRGYHLPRDAGDLLALRRAAEVWMRESFGQHGRSPVFMSSVAVGLHDFHDRLAGARPEFGANAEAYHRFAAERDLVLTHALGDPQIDRSSDPVQDPDLALRVLRQDADGIVVRGAKQLTTLAPFAHEVVVYLSPSFAGRGAEDLVVWFALPLNAEGLHVLCREPLGTAPHGHSHAFAARFDEQDSMLFFDDVHVPWNRVFLLGDGGLAREGFARLNAWSQYVGQVRYRERLRTLLAVGTLLAESIGVAGFRNIQEDLGELTGYVETLDHFLAAGEATARRTDGGLLAPGPTPAAAVWAAQVSDRALRIVRNIGQSGILMQPSENDLRSPELRPFLDRYMRGKDIDVAAKSRLFRLAWELTADGFGQRQDLYEFVHRGDLARNRINLFHRHDQSETLARLRALIAEPLTPGTAS